jgi:polyisoprenoid-binding protein YceI
MNRPGRLGLSALALCGAALLPAEAQPTMQVDLARSHRKWTGTKFRGRGRHEGIVRLRAAELDVCTPTNCRGRFTIDMHNLEVTDIPATDPVPRRRLTEHLQSRDFFWTERYPVAIFTITGTRTTSRADSVLASGQLALRGVIRPLLFTARIIQSFEREVHVRAELTIDRQQWGIRYRFDPIRELRRIEAKGLNQRPGESLLVHVMHILSGAGPRTARGARGRF